MKCQCGNESRRSPMVFPWYCSCGVIWESETERRRGPCKHLREETGKFVACRTCGGGVIELPVFRCAKHVETVQRRPVQAPGHEPWDGMVCLICIAQGLNE